MQEEEKKQTGAAETGPAGGEPGSSAEEFRYTGSALSWNPHGKKTPAERAQARQERRLRARRRQDTGHYISAKESNRISRENQRITRAFENGEYSFSAAIGLFNSLINFVVIVTFNKISRKISEVSLW